jgi:hypothetical protein
MAYPNFYIIWLIQTFILYGLPKLSLFILSEPDEGYSDQTVDSTALCREIYFDEKVNYEALSWKS